MEQIGALLKGFGKTNHVTKHVTQYALNKEKAKHVNITCTYDTIPKREYGLLLRKMESWGITAPKAIVKKYGVFIVKRAVEYTEHTPNVRNKAGYMTYMCGQFKTDAQPVTNHIEEQTQNPPVQEPTRRVKSKKGISKNR